MTPMKLIALLLARNEEHEIGFTLRCLLKFADAVVVLEHQCIDRTHEIVCECAAEVGTGRVIVAADDHQDWQEMRLRMELLTIARQHGATHIWLGDADECISSNLLWVAGSPQINVIRGHIAATPPGQILCLPLYNLRGGIAKYHADGIWGRRITSVAFADRPSLGWFGDHYHSREPRTTDGRRGNLYEPVRQGEGGIIHLWGAEERRLIARHAWYKLTHRGKESRAEIERMYNLAIKGQPGNQHYGTPATWNYADVPAAWLGGYEDLIARHLHLGQVPWQEQVVRDIVAADPRSAAGLDLFGVA